MRRIQFIELHEQSWLPSTIRDEVTETLQFGFDLSKAYSPIIPLLNTALHDTGRQTVVDLCSGGGGPWLDLARQLRERVPALRIWLTDKYPNLRAVRNVQGRGEEHIAVYETTVDAMDVPRGLRGFRTMFTSFHHFSPEEGRAILQNAVDAGEGMGIFEVTGRNLSSIPLILGWVFLLVLCTPWIRPFRWSRLVWTYLFPVIPVVLMFDGVVSCLRTYRPDELKQIVSRVVGNEYRWEIGENWSGKVPIVYLIGYPRMGATAV